MSYVHNELDYNAAEAGVPAPQHEGEKPTRRPSRSSGSVNSLKKAHETEAEREQHILEKEIEKDEEEVEEDRQWRHNIYKKLRPFILGGLAALILAWWISATVLKATRHRWYALVITLLTYLY